MSDETASGDRPSTGDPSTDDPSTDDPSDEVRSESAGTLPTSGLTASGLSASRLVSGPGSTSAGPPKGVLNQTVLQRLGHQARSVVVPALLVVLLSLGGLVISIVGIVGVLSQVDTDAPGDVPAAVCQTRTTALQTALLAYRNEEGRDATRVSDLDPYLDASVASHTVDFSTTPPSVAIIEGGGCDYPEAAVGATVSSEVGDRVRADFDAVDLGFGALYVAGYFVVLAAVFLQGWWLASAYRCLPVSQQRRSPRSAYTPFIVYLTGGFLSTVGINLAVAIEVDPFTLLFVAAVGAIVYLGIFIASLLQWISMLGDVNFGFGRHTAPARLLRGSLVWFLILAVVLPPSLLFASFVTSAQWVAGLAVLILFAIWSLLPALGVISYIVAVVLATYEIESTLRSAAVQLGELEQRGWLYINQRKQRVHR